MNGNHPTEHAGKVYNLALAKTPKPEVIYAGTIYLLHDYRFTSREISDLLAEQGVKITPRRIAAFLRETKPQHRPQQ